ncbi:unnamed protein product [Spirodela intermedia]|uniref:Uncharacterized protein n=1 Tax=Spirodela intermedia TaxID=51605 RepID=A0A7I8IGI4_SPIIN|nr:unnamed protein product [Spirodela intermedia]CAA6656183.1 unnamed protein product [Spirodela intermedia]
MASLPVTDGGRILTDAWDYKGRPAIRSQTGAGLLNERLTSLGIAVNLVTYMTGTMHLGNAVAANTVTNFLGTSFILCLLGGFIADTFLGSCVPSSDSCIPASGIQLAVLYLALYMTALGTGGLKSSVSGFGSDQFDESNPWEKNRMMKFFNYFFFLISLGSLVAVTVLVYVQDNLGRRWGYGICATSILIGLLVFLSGTRRYRFKKLVGSPLTQIFSVVVVAWRNRRLPLPSEAALLYDVGEQAKLDGRQGETKQPLPHTKQFRGSVAPSRWRLNTLTDVEEVKMVVRMLPIWATTIMFWTVYAQMTTFSVSRHHHGPQGCGLLRDPTGLTDGLLRPLHPPHSALLRPPGRPVFRHFTGNSQGLTPLQRIGVGLVLSAMAMVAAALTEIKRQRVATTVVDPHGPVPMSVFWLIPQFLLVGSGEAFAYIGQLDFFLRECPSGMKTMSTGLFLSTLSLGFFLSSALVTIVDRVTGHGGHRSWLADDLNHGRLYDFYWLLAVLSVLNLIVYLVSARWYVYRERGESPADDGNLGVELRDAETSHHG